MTQLHIRGKIVSAIVLFKKDDAPDYADLGLKINQENIDLDNYESCDLRFDITEVSTYNEATLKGGTTLRLKSGDCFLLGHDFKEFDNFILLNQK